MQQSSPEEVCNAGRMEGARKVRVGAPPSAVGFTMRATTLNLFTHLLGRAPREFLPSRSADAFGAL